MIDQKNLRYCGIFVGIAMILMLSGNVEAENIKLYGVQLPAWSGGGFRPTGTQLTCAATSEDGKCWDGQTWHRLFPDGPRRYSRANGHVACRVIIVDDGSCWDGSAWYRLPIGTVYGIVAPVTSETPGAFITTPLPPK